VGNKLTRVGKARKGVCILAGEDNLEATNSGKNQAEENMRKEVRNRIKQQENQVEAEVRRTSKTYQGLKWLAVLASAVPLIVVLVFRPSHGTEIAIGVASALGTVLAITEGQFGWRARWEAARNAWDKARELGDKFASGEVPPEQVDDKLTELRDGYTNVLHAVIKKEVTLPPQDAVGGSGGTAS
jgi:hypothetical protein